MIQTLWIPGPLPGLNEMLAGAKVFGRKTRKNGKRWNAYDALKESHEKLIVSECIEQKIKPVNRARFVFVWNCPNKRRDKDNVAAGKKLIFDALKHAKVIPDDRWDIVLGWEDRFVITKDPGVMVEIYEEE